MNAAAKTRTRLDQLVAELGLAPSREKARALILAGRVQVDGERRDKPGYAPPAGSEVTLLPGKRPFASRAGGKLSGALDDLGLDPASWRCLDVGSSTGGFTDALLQRGVVHVTALDVGRGLLDQKLRDDPRVLVREGINARYVTPSEVEPPYDLATLDLSFISTTLVLPALFGLVPEGRILVMVKPQFELTAREVGRGGVVRDPALRARAVRRVGDFLRQHKWGIQDIAASQVAGPKGNREVFVLAEPGPGLAGTAFDARLDEEILREADRP